MAMPYGPIDRRPHRVTADGRMSHEAIALRRSDQMLAEAEAMWRVMLQGRQFTDHPRAAPPGPQRHLIHPDADVPMRQSSILG